MILGVGTNRRYARQVGAQMDRRINQMVTRPQPISLSDLELDKDHQPVRTPSTPVPVWAWVRFPEAPIRASGRAIAWTDRAVLVEWEDADGRTYRAWVWASAVERITSS